MLRSCARAGAITASSQCIACKAAHRCCEQPAVDSPARATERTARSLLRENSRPRVNSSSCTPTCATLSICTSSCSTCSFSTMQGLYRLMHLCCWHNMHRLKSAAWQHKALCAQRQLCWLCIDLQACTWQRLNPSVLDAHASQASQQHAKRKACVSDCFIAMSPTNGSSASAGMP